MSEQLNLDALVDDTPTTRYPLAAAFHKDEPEAFALIVAWAHVDQEAGRECSMQLYIELLRRPELRPEGFRSTGRVYLVNHNARAELARYVHALHPRLRFRFRDASCDPPAAPNATPKAGGAMRA